MDNGHFASQWLLPAKSIAWNTIGQASGFRTVARARKECELHHARSNETVGIYRILDSSGVPHSHYIADTHSHVNWRNGDLPESQLMEFAEIQLIRNQSTRQTTCLDADIDFKSMTAPVRRTLNNSPTKRVTLAGLSGIVALQNSGRLVLVDEKMSEQPKLTYGDLLQLGVTNEEFVRWFAIPKFNVPQPLFKYSFALILLEKTKLIDGRYFACVTEQEIIIRLVHRHANGRIVLVGPEGSPNEYINEAADIDVLGECVPYK
ncbi:MAG: hypothetical protein EVA65_16610 [Oceanococcus sp.]|nr:MAG: hypothetical protein EVA65_16610 [Oceanococcus sp.]